MAMFKGSTDSSKNMGFRPGERYCLELRFDMRTAEVGVENQEPPNQFCPYSNFSKLLDNWSNIIKIK